MPGIPRSIEHVDPAVLRRDANSIVGQQLDNSTPPLSIDGFAVFAPYLSKDPFVAPPAIRACRRCPAQARPAATTQSGDSKPIGRNRNAPCLSGTSAHSKLEPTDG